MKKDNPFTLTFGKKPAEYISRYENLDAIISTFEADNPVSQAYLVEGIRGSGKTVLMTTAAGELAFLHEWIVVDLNSTQNLLENLALRLNADLSVHDYIGQIEEILASLKKKRKRVIITIDEVLHDQNMRHFASEFQIWLRKDYPVFLLMTGLYENI